MRLCGPQNHSAFGNEEKNIILPEIEPTIFRLITCHGVK
jgi:hypothetical protein